jgi:hypothetical protein
MFPWSTSLEVHESECHVIKRTESRVGVPVEDEIVAGVRSIVVTVMTACWCLRLLWPQAVTARKANQRIFASIRLPYSTAVRHGRRTVNFLSLALNIMSGS